MSSNSLDLVGWPQIFLGTERLINLARTHDTPSLRQRRIAISLMRRQLYIPQYRRTQAQIKAHYPLLEGTQCYPTMEAQNHYFEQLSFCLSGIFLYAPESWPGRVAGYSLKTPLIHYEDTTQYASHTILHVSSLAHSR